MNGIDRLLGSVLMLHARGKLRIEALAPMRTLRFARSTGILKRSPSQASRSPTYLLPAASWWRATLLSHVRFTAVAAALLTVWGHWVRPRRSAF